MENHRVLQRLVELSTMDQPDEAKIEAIDRDISRAMAHVINTIRKIHLSPFSPQIKQARLLFDVLRNLTVLQQTVYGNDTQGNENT
jgi:hypothetical protein